MIYIYILVMAGVTYLIRMLPLTLIQKKISNVYVRLLILCALHLSDSYDLSGDFICNEISAFGACRLCHGCTAGLKEKSLVTVALFSCGAVFVAERIMELL